MVIITHTHRTWEPEFDMNTEEGLVSNLLLLSAEYHNCEAYRAPTGGSIPRALGAKKSYDLGEFLNAALKGDRIVMPYPGASILLHTDLVKKGVGRWGSDRETGHENCKHYESPGVPARTIKGIDFAQCSDTDKACYCADKCQEAGLHHENKRFSEIPRPLAEIVEYVVSGEAEKDRAKEIEEAEE